MDNLNESNLDSTDIARKSAELSEVARKHGNNILKKNIQDHNRREHREMLFLYSKSIAYAPNNSEELALGYGNRSYLLSHLKMYEASITDIDRALEISKSNALKAKLICRKISALKSMDKKVPESVINEARTVIGMMHESLKPSFTVALENIMKEKKDIYFEYRNHQYINMDLPDIDFNTELPTTSTCTQMQYSRDYGRHYVSTKNILPGEILIAEKGFASVPKNEVFYVVCSFCLTIAWSGIPCNNCPCVIYCSEKCKVAAWKSYHELECPILVLIFNEIITKRDILNEYTEQHFLSSTFLTLKILMKGLKEDSNQSLDYLLEEFLLAKNAKEERSKGFKNNIFNTESIRSIFSLISHFGLHKSGISCAALQKLILVLNAKFEKLFKSSKFYPSFKKLNIQTFGDLITYIFCVVEVNAFTYFVCHCDCDDKATDEQFYNHKFNCIINMGRIIGACQSLVNHSCVPNATKMVKDGKVILLSIRPINKNEQICCSYNPTLTDPLPVRKGYLYAKYHFDCSCIGCTEQWNLTEADITAQMLKACRYFGKDFLIEVRNFISNITHKREMVHKTEMQRILHEVKTKLTKVYKSNSLFNALSICSLLPDVLQSIYDAYYAGDTYMPDDSIKYLTVLKGAASMMREELGMSNADINKFVNNLSIS